MAKKTASKRKKLIIGSTSSPAAEVIGRNEDLLSEILLRVPAKSLIRFKCVSKNWRLLISDSHFAFNHARRNRNCSTSGLYFYYDSSSRTIPVNSLSLHCQSSLPSLAFLDGVAGESAKIRIKSSCNGLLLCKCENDLDRTSYVVCNPTTQSYTVLPEIDGFSFASYLAFNPSKSPHYKVVLVGDNGEIDIYSSEIRSWKHTVVNAPSDRQLEGVFWNGAIHWLLDNDNHSNVHYRFEVDEEKLIRTPVPPRPEILYPGKIRYFGECGGHLILIQMRLVYAVGFRVLEMDKDYCWIVKCRVNLRPLISAFPEIGHNSRSSKFELLSVVKGKNKKAFVLVLVIAGKVISCSLKFKTWKVLLDHVPPGYPQEPFRFHYLYPFAFTLQFVESLSPV